MRKHYMVEVGLRENSLRIEANDQIEAIRLAQHAILEDGLLIFVQRMYKGEPAEDHKIKPLKGALLYGDQGTNGQIRET